MSPMRDEAGGGTKILCGPRQGTSRRRGQAGRPGRCCGTARQEGREERPPPEAPPRRSRKPAAAESSGGGLASLLRIRKPKTPKKDEELQLDEPPQNAADYELPSIELLLPSETFNFDEQENEVRRKAKILEQTFKEFGFNIRVVEIQTGPVIAQFEVELEAGLRLSKITGLADDLAIALRVPSVRIVAPIPGKNTVGIEVPNTTRQIVRLREVIEEANGKAQKMRIPVYLGKDVSGNPMTVDLSTLPHLLDRRPHGHGQERLPELDHHLDGHDPAARRGPHADDRPQDGRTQPVQEPAAPHAPRGHRHEEGRGDPGLGRGEDGRAVPSARPGGRAAPQRLQPVGRGGVDGADPSRRTTTSAARFPRTCPTS